MRWSYLCTVGRCAHYTYSVCMKLDMLLSKNVVVFTRKVLFVNLVLCWRAVSWGQNPSCNFTLDHAPWLFLWFVLFFFIFWNNICHFHNFGIGRDAQLVLSCRESNMQSILGSVRATQKEESVKRDLSRHWQMSVCVCFQCITWHKKC